MSFVAQGPKKFVPKLVYSSPRGRFEVSTRPDGGVRIDNVVGSSDELDAGEVMRLMDRMHQWQLESEAEDDEAEPVSHSDTDKEAS